MILLQTVRRSRNPICSLTTESKQLMEQIHVLSAEQTFTTKLRDISFVAQLILDLDYARIW